MALVDDVAHYYAERGPVFDETAGYTDPEAERLREPIKARWQELFAGHDVLEIACGTGYWTLAVAGAANSVLGVDIHPSLLAAAADRCRHLPRVKFRIADAYTMEGVPTGFRAAFATYWWSHVPRDRLATFLAALHGKLHPGALVLFVDQLPYKGAVRRTDPGGNTIEERSLPDGRTFEIVKNFPTEDEIRAALAGFAEDVEWVERPEEGTWSVTYRTSG